MGELKDLPTTVSSILSSNRAMATMTKTSCRDPRHETIHALNRPRWPFGGAAAALGELFWWLLLVFVVGLGVVAVECAVPVLAAAAAGLVGKTPPGSVDCISTSSESETGKSNYYYYTGNWAAQRRLVIGADMDASPFNHHQTISHHFHPQFNRFVKRAMRKYLMSIKYLRIFAKQPHVPRNGSYDRMSGH